MMNQEERKGQRLYERDFARERREELLPFLEKLVNELKSSDQDVDTIQQLLYDARWRFINDEGVESNATTQNLNNLNIGDTKNLKFYRVETTAS